MIVPLRELGHQNPILRVLHSPGMAQKRELGLAPRERQKVNHTGWRAAHPRL